HDPRNSLKFRVLRGSLEPTSGVRVPYFVAAPGETSSLDARQPPTATRMGGHLIHPQTVQGRREPFTARNMKSELHSGYTGKQ
ncbi:hypothetical protein, partial [Kocuria rhizophila]|uniref:hypothetical protein n=1 Tax=Kocuria rhizophila TaxID=72000 RepID=UPI0021A70984